MKNLNKSAIADLKENINPSFHDEMQDLLTNEGAVFARL